MKNTIKIALFALAALLSTAQVQAAWYDSIINMLGAAKYKIAALGAVSMAGVAGYKKIKSSNDVYNLESRKLGTKLSPTQLAFEGEKYYTTITKNTEKGKIVTTTALNMAEKEIASLEKSLAKVLQSLNHTYMIRFPRSNITVNQLNEEVYNQLTTDSLYFYDDEQLYNKLAQEKPWKLRGFIQLLHDETLEYLWNVCLKIHRNLFRWKVFHGALVNPSLSQQFQTLFKDDGSITDLKANKRDIFIGFHKKVFTIA